MRYNQIRTPIKIKTITLSKVSTKFPIIYTFSFFRDLRRQTISNKTMKTKGLALKAMIWRTASTLSERIMAKPRRPRIKPQISFILTLGSGLPPSENIDKTNAALTTLVTINKNAASIVTPIVRFDSGRVSRRRKLV